MWLFRYLLAYACLLDVCILISVMPAELNACVHTYNSIFVFFIMSLGLPKYVRAHVCLLVVLFVSVYVS